MIATNLVLLAATASSAFAVAIDRRANSRAYINFNKDFSQTQLGEIDYTDEIQVIYDLNRILPSCNATASTPNVDVTAYYSFNGDVAKTASLLNTYATPAVTSQTFTVPARSGFGDLSFWFACSNNGKVAWDSNFGKNYAYTVAGGLVQFKKDFTSVVKGSLKAGKPVGITYEFDRATCKAPTDGYEVIRAYWSTPSGKQGSATVGSSSYVYHSGLVKSTFTAVIAPEDVTAGDLSIWFQCQTAFDSQFDSNFGKNWKVTVSA
ncbi:hypothetical protein HDU96_010244 [Phlyctochytrium bullatum]|nr:hypothetical protein HDU96_010244 [Phlyctochytrium bullatum]